METQERRELPVSRTTRPARPPEFLIELEPWTRVFLRNLRDLFRPRIEPTQMLTSRPAPFWPDVFVPAGIPRRPLLQSILYHVFLVVALWGLSSTFVFRPPVVRDSFFRDQKITYYDVSEYLPAIDTGSEPAKQAKKGEPEYAPQPIVSLPKHPDNSTQTIVDPIDPRLVTEEAKLPNMVVWTELPAPPVAARSLSKLAMPALAEVAPPPAPDPTRNLAQLTAPKLAQTVVPPAPDVGSKNLNHAKLPPIASPGAVAPAPDVAPRKMGDVNIAQSNMVVTNPALPMPVQRAANLVSGSAAATEFGAAAAAVPPPPPIDSGRAPSGKTAAHLDGAAAAVPPPPSIDSSGGSGAKPMGQFIALSVRPSPPTGPIEVPGGNRRGVFASTPEGKPGAPGTPDIAGGGTNGGGGGNGTGKAGPGTGSNSSTAPPGIFIGGASPSKPAGAVVAAAAPPPPPPVGGDALRRNLLAAAPHALADIARSTPRGSSPDRDPDAPSHQLEDKVFAGRKSYSMILNMPNLTSAGGSWIIRFAELHQSGGPGDLTAPVAMSKVDPAYPIELMRKNIEGTVTLYAVIRADGSVSGIKVLEGVDDRLDASAKAALARWRFQPATKNGSPVDLEAVVIIPFKAKRVTF